MLNIAERTEDVIFPLNFFCGYLGKSQRSPPSPVFLASPKLHRNFTEKTRVKMKHWDFILPVRSTLGFPQPMPIQPLPTDTVHRIAAGEVIDSLAAVVRELVENSIDAGATRIAVALQSDQWQVCVTDDGSGISLEDLQNAARPHSTSKIRSSDDLNRINSLGFRGEALHSLAQLAQLEICSRASGAVTGSGDRGWRVIYDANGNPGEPQAVAIAPGTTATVTGLFERWPARRQALPHPAQQLRAIQLTLQAIALCHPQITWKAEQNDKAWFSIWPGDSAKKLLPQLIRGVTEADLRTADFRTTDFRTADFPSQPSDRPSQLVLALPDRCHRRRPDWVKIAVNGRCVRLPELEHRILGSLRRSLPRDRFPIAFLHLHLHPREVDWNRHPAKTEIYLRNLPTWQAALQEAIATALTLAPPGSQLAAESERTLQVLKTAEAQGQYQVSRQISPLPESAQTSAQTSAQASVSPSRFPTLDSPLLTAIAQIHKTYIAAEHPSGLWLVEQHIAHERVLYEQICDRWHCIPREPPLILNQLSEAQLEQLDRIGIETEPFGEGLWAVRTVPAILADREDCADAILELSLGGDLQTAQVATACRSAIRNGTPLSLPEMQQLLNQWQQTQHPQTCPHGRPIYMALEETSLSRFFRRHWVIGKSHGLGPV